MGIIRESFVIYRKWDEAIRKAPEGVQLELYHAIMDFAITGEKPQGLSWEADMLLTSLELQMESNIARYNASVENGKLGGRPKKNADENKNLEEPSETQKNLEEPSHNLNVNDNVYVNDNVNDILLDNNKKIIEEKENKNACMCVREKFSNFFNYHSTDKFAKKAEEIIKIMEDLQQKQNFKFKAKSYTNKDIQLIQSTYWYIGWSSSRAHKENSLWCWFRWWFF